MPPLETQVLERLVEIMRDMQEMATTTNWQELARLDSERRALLRYDPAYQTSDKIKSSYADPPTRQATQTCHSSFATPTHDVHRESLINEIRELDKTIIASVQEARRHLLNENRDLSAQLKAKELYARTSSMT